MFFFVTHQSILFSGGYCGCLSGGKISMNKCVYLENIIYLFVYQLIIVEK